MENRTLQWDDMLLKGWTQQRGRRGACALIQGAEKSGDSDLCEFTSLLDSYFASSL
jgi:hypothetical protein